MQKVLALLIVLGLIVSCTKKTEPEQTAPASEMNAQVVQDEPTEAVQEEPAAATEEEMSATEEAPAESN